MRPVKSADTPNFGFSRAVGVLRHRKVEISGRVEQLVSLALAQIGIPPESWRAGCSIFSAIIVSGLAWAKHR